jgi:hypothetical protein
MVKQRLIVNAVTNKSGRLTALWCALGTVGVLTYLAAHAETQLTPPGPSPASTAQPSSNSTSNAHASAPRLSVSSAEILRLLGAGVDRDLIKAYIQNSTKIYSPSVDEIVTLKERAVPSDIIVALLTRARELRSQAAQAAVAKVGTIPTAPGTVPQDTPVYPAPGPTVYAPEPAYNTVPASTSYGYPSYDYSYLGYPFFSTIWWAPTWGYYPYWRWSGHPDHRHGWAGSYAANRVQSHWADTYPNRLIAGPNWGADRGFINRPAATARSQVRWAGSYPNRLIAGPNWGADRSFVNRPAANSARGTAGGFGGRPSGPVRSGMGGRGGRR